MVVDSCITVSVFAVALCVLSRGTPELFSISWRGLLC